MAFICLLVMPLATLAIRWCTLLHGNGNNETSWFDDSRAQAQLDALIASRQIPPVIAISPDAGLSWYVNRREPFATAFI
jgi:hypothetical protein